MRPPTHDSTVSIDGAVAVRFMMEEHPPRSAGLYYFLSYWKIFRMGATEVKVFGQQYNGEV
ncbi:hypothetical protein O9992_20815 [Vibrio lentus]|nr:hypothetical protein [Vibrio lentus]